LASRQDLLEAIAACEGARDFGSRDILSDILEHEEEHIDWIETQLDLIQRVGLQNYLQQQIEPGEEGK
jgi:bacterioferritin